ncbi:DUF4296 domain-containing protein [Agriterribacter sp.]|uniref:DUF4296 domain-containing protein n=1 Tax=Agriterribacter sp. TaxID=2821509 RepID=UPI002BB892EF|nr:DUF4296 domain-containing protein [Agriterribacter sp.]HRP54719.1 DUF4296 domain-containing protein [Agriterribacter sp.]
MRMGLYIVLAVLLLTGCSRNKVPDDVIQPHEMGNILFEITMAEEFVNAYVAKDSSKSREAEIQKEYQKIFLLHEITEAQFKESYDFYRSHTGIFKTMMDSLNARAQRKRNELYHMPN